MLFFLVGVYLGVSIVAGAHMFGLRERHTVPRIIATMASPITVPLLLIALAVMYVTELSND